MDNSFAGLVIYKIQNQEFCSDTNKIVNIIETSKCIYNFNGKNYELKYDGRIYVIIPFDKIYKLNFKIGPLSRIILMNITGKLIAFIVDEIIEYMIVDKENSLKISYYHSYNPKIKMIIKCDDREIIFPNFELLFPGNN
ncbi:MAG: chemotaxis protein CheW [Ignavibacteriaceae bacterium]|nr:chemotaxis protein CheW [Ignavibacteriaceae bacterium]